MIAAKKRFPGKRFGPRLLLALGLLVLATLSLPAASQAASPAIRASLTAYPTNFSPDTPNQDDLPEYAISIVNVGAATTSAPISATLTLPPGITESGTGLQTVNLTHSDFFTSANIQELFPGENAIAWIPVDVGSLPEGSSVSARVEVVGGGSAPAAASAATTISAAPASFGFLPGTEGLAGAVTDADGSVVTQAGARPYQLFADLDLTSRLTGAGPGATQVAGVEGGVRDLRLALPPGLVVDPAATSVRCTEAQLTSRSCPDASAVGIVGVKTAPFADAQISPVPSALYNLVPPPGAPAAFGFDAAGAGIFIHVLGGVRAGDYALVADTNDILSRPGQQILGAEIQLWGDPTDPSHDLKRGRCLNLNGGVDGHNSNGGNGGLPQRCPVAPNDRPLLTMPTACASELPLAASADSWLNPGDYVDRAGQLTDEAGEASPVSGCAQVPFEPTIDLAPTTDRAESPAGMDVSLKVPQPQGHDTLASAHLKRAVVTLPEGMSLNPSASDGLASCSTTEVGLTSTSPIVFDLNPHQCPDASKVGSATIHTPLLPDPLEGELFLADQDDNPFDALLSGYLVAQGHGLVIKIAGEFETDPQTGQIKAIFNNNPQQPFSELELHFKGGPRGVLVTPPTCGIYTIESKLSSWAAADPENPTPAEVVTDTSTFTVDSAPDGGPCLAGDPSQPADQADRADRPFAPGFSGGVVHPNAGSSSPFVLRATRQDGEQEITRLNADLPPGLTAKLAGIPQCSEATINAIPTALGTGAAEKASPSCPAGSLLGSTQVGAGAGSQLTYIPGSVYLAGPYQGAPLSLAIVTPAVTGPFDLGNVVIRTKLLIDQDDAQVHAVSDPLPTILEGIPLHIRDIRVTMDRPGFIQTPTNCNPMAVTGSLGGGGGVLASTADDISAAVSDRFQVSGCGGLGFSPKLSGAILNGQDGIHRSDHPNLLFSLHGTPGDANLSRVEVLLPQNFQIDQANLGNICSETQLATQDCAGRQRIGTASATTPLLDTPLSGPVYAVSGSGGLPKLAVILYGPPSMPIKLVVRGITETVGARIKNTFPLVPDAPVSDFALNLDGGPQGYLVNNSDLCGSSSKGKKSKKKKGKGKRSFDASAAKKKKGKKKSRSSATGIAADASFFGQNGGVLRQSVPISADCGSGRSGGGKKGKKRSRKRG